ncbi:MAG: GNAT family N-acetyltransferase [Clostridium sp.]
MMEEAFPKEEIRTYEGQLNLLENPYYWLKRKMDEEGNLTAFLAVWEFEEFSFVEHLAVSREFRGNGIGGLMMREYIQQSVKPVVLEVELPETDIAKRRIAFYERLGFQLNDFAYQQPPMRKGHGWYPLMIMSFPSSLTEEEFEPIKKKIYREVYQTRE